MRKFIYILTMMLVCGVAYAQTVTDEMMVLDVSSITDEQLDTIDVKKKLIVNDYSMIGIQARSRISCFRPSMWE